MKSAANKASKKKYCAEADCKSEAVSHGFCRLHYIANWKHLRLNKQVKAERRLNAYVDRLTKKYPADYLDKIKEGLENEEKFKQTVNELDLEADSENPETEREFLERFNRNIKGSE